MIIPGAYRPTNHKPDNGNSDYREWGNHKGLPLQYIDRPMLERGNDKTKNRAISNC